MARAPGTTRAPLGAEGRAATQGSSWRAPPRLPPRCSGNFPPSWPLSQATSRSTTCSCWADWSACQLSYRRCPWSAPCHRRSRKRPQGARGLPGRRAVPWPSGSWWFARAQPRDHVHPKSARLGPTPLLPSSLQPLSCRSWAQRRASDRWPAPMRGNPRGPFIEYHVRDPAPVVRGIDIAPEHSAPP